MPTWPNPTSIWHDDTYAAISPTRPELSLAGKTAVITGGGAGIGAAIARSVAAAGCTKIALLGRREQLLLDNKARILSLHPKAGITVLTVSTDVKNAASVTAAFKTVAAAFGKLDVLVHNAASFAGVISIDDSIVSDWWSAFEVNVLGSFLVTKEFLKYVDKDAKGVQAPRIIDISTGVAHMPATWPGFSAYGASKAGALRFYEWLQFENPDLHVVNVHPGTVATEMSSRAPGAQPSDKPELPGDFVVWAASEEASFLKGRLAWSNWDVPELLKRKDEIKNSNEFTLTLDGWPWGQ